MTQAITKNDIEKATRELNGMRGALRSWLAYRLKNDQVMVGIAPPGRRLRPGAREIVASVRDLGVEQRLATQLHALLTETMKPQIVAGARLPDPDLRNNPRAAVELAQIALGERVIGRGLGPNPHSSLSGLGPVPWPVVIVVGVLLTITTAIKTNADLAAEKERIACIKAGACTDYGFWLKTAALVGLGWFAWTKMGVGRYLTSGGRRG